MSGLKSREVKLKKELVQMMGEKDESIRQAFTSFDQKVGQSFGMLEMKFAVVVKALAELGLPEERLQAIFEEVQAQVKQGEQPEQSATGGEDNGANEPYGEEPTGAGSEPSEESETGACEERGSEHFG